MVSWELVFTKQSQKDAKKIGNFSITPCNRGLSSK